MRGISDGYVVETLLGLMMCMNLSSLPYDFTWGMVDVFGRV